ncbi:DUF3365 domain-containing protein [bacterium]|nr:DUF3365 domain-containing protein [bacterium]
MSIHKLIAAGLLTACLVLALPACTDKEEAPPPVDAETAEHVAACRAAMKKLGGALKARLEAAVQADGLVGALEVCNVEAVPITKTISREEGLMVGRTSLRARNPGNAPDDWERGILAEFAARRVKGEDPAALEAWAIREDADGQRTFRYMKAIPTAALCLNCHGSELEPAVTAKIAALYPQDTATGYAEGDIRGAFTIVKPIE